MAASKKQVKWSQNYRRKKKNDVGYKQKVSLRNKKTNAIRDGRETKPAKGARCPNCGRTGFRKEFHHFSYGSKGKNGEWRCSACNPRPGQ